MSTKKYLFLSGFFMGLLVITSPNVFAQISTEVLEINLAKVDYRYNALLEFFLQKTKEKDYGTTYGLLAGNFAKLQIEDFTHIVNELGLTDFTAKKWTSFKDEMKSIGVTTVKGDFTTPDDVIHHLTFFVIIGGETEIKIGHIGEEINTAALAKRFPQEEMLRKLIQQDLRHISLFIRKNRAKKTYMYLSDSAKKRIKLRDIRKAIRTFKKLKLNVALPKKAQMTLASERLLNELGQMVISGNYNNKTHNVNFTLAYDYENWRWKLGFFELSAQSKQ